MTFERIEALLRAAEGRGLAVLEFTDGDAVLRVRFDPPVNEPGLTPDASPLSSASSSPSSLDASAVPAPGVGFFRMRHPAGFAGAAPGDAVEAGAVVAFIQAGPVLQPVAAPVAGVLGEALVAEGAAVDYGTPLFRLT